MSLGQLFSPQSQTKTHCSLMVWDFSVVFLYIVVVLYIYIIWSNLKNFSCLHFSEITPHFLCKRAEVKHMTLTYCTTKLTCSGKEKWSGAIHHKVYSAEVSTHLSHCELFIFISIII